MQRAGHVAYPGVGTDSDCGGRGPLSSVCQRSVGKSVDELGRQSPIAIDKQRSYVLTIKAASSVQAQMCDGRTIGVRVTSMKLDHQHMNTYFDRKS